MTQEAFVAKGSFIVDGTGYMILPVGTTAERPTQSKGMFRYNSTDDVVEFTDGTTWSQFTTAVSAESWIGKTGAYTMVNGDNVLADTSGGAFILTLPATPSIGARCRVIDVSRSFATNNITIARNGSNIKGAASDLVLEKDGLSIDLVYSDATNGWVPESVTDGNETFWVLGDSVYATFAALKADGTPPTFKTSVFTLGSTATYDGGEGHWVWHASSTEADDNTTVLLPTGHTGAGRWRKVGSSAALRTWSLISTNTTVSTNTRYGVDTSGGVVTLTLPGTPDAGEILVSDRAGTFDANNCQVNVTNGGHTIDGAAAPFILTQKNSTTRFVYDSANTNWVVLRTTDSETRAKRLLSATAGYIPTHDANGHITGEIDPDSLQTTLPQVSQADAEAGTSNVFSSWSPERSKQAIKALGDRLIASALIQLVPTTPVTTWEDGFSNISFNSSTDTFTFTLDTSQSDQYYQVLMYLEGVGSQPGATFLKSTSGFSHAVPLMDSGYYLSVRVYAKPA